MWHATLTLAFAASLPAQADDLTALRDKAVKAAVKKVSPSVVTIETQGGTDIVVTGGGGRRGARLLKGRGPTTGVIVGADGYIITSAYNFANKPSSIVVAIPGRKERLVAKAVCTDQTRMLTLLKVDATGLPVPKPAPVADIKIGYTALALGRTLVADVNQMPSVNKGIVSALHRIWGKAIQTDAKVSPVNYGGPLVDLNGRVMGVLVPASPRAEGETAGFEWYDSGIGFAIPLEDILRVLPRLKEGKDVRKGVLGVTMRSNDMYDDEPAVNTIAPASAAESIGLKSGDVIKEIDGKAVHNYAQVLHQLGSKYEGDFVALKVQRGKDTLTFAKVKLGGAIAAFNQPFLGILPMRDDPDAGVAVRYVFPKSPAAAAGIKVGDRIVKIGPAANRLRAVANRTELANLVASARPGGRTMIQVVGKDKKPRTVTVTIGEYQDVIPAKLPEKASLEKARTKAKPAAPPKKDGKKEDKKDEKKEEKKEDKEKGKAPTGLLKRTNQARDRHYWIYVPDDYNPDISYALVIWLHPVGKNKDRDVDAITLAWDDFCSKNHIIMVGPKSENEAGWVGSESEFVQEATRAVMTNYTIDRRRVVAHGMGVGGQMAFYLGFAARDLVRGVATIGSVLGSNPKERVPNQPLAFYLAVGEKDPICQAVKASKEKLTEHRYPVNYNELKAKGHQYYDLEEKEGRDAFEELMRWIDSLDRI